MVSISTHILDTAQGRPAKGVPIHLFKQAGDQFTLMAQKLSDEKGRSSLIENGTVGSYRLEFLVKDYFMHQNQCVFFPKVTIELILNEDQHYHVPLLLSPFGFSSYRGC